MTKVGIFGLTGCAGCQLSIIFNEDEILDIAGAVNIVAFPFIKSNNSKGHLDICFIEGTVVSKDDERVVKNLRKRSDIVVAIGTCACEGNIPALRNFTDERKIDYLKFKKSHQNQDTGEPKPIHEVVKVEYMLPGCPPDRDEVKNFIKDILLGKEFRSYKDPVCVECRLKDNGCLLEKGMICLGSIARGGCKAVCPSHGLRCYGCRGLCDNPNMDEFHRLMKDKGHDMGEVRKVMNTFMARSIKNEDNS